MYCPEGDCTQFRYKHYFYDFCSQPVHNTTHSSTTKHEISQTAANPPTALGLAPIVSALVSFYLMCILLALGKEVLTLSHRKGTANFCNCNDDESPNHRQQQSLCLLLITTTASHLLLCTFISAGKRMLTRFVRKAGE